MGDDYLWDRSGERDPEIERLEKALAPLKYAEPAEGFGARAPAPAPPIPGPIPIARARRARWIPFALAAAAIAAGALFELRRPATHPLEARRFAPLVPVVTVVPVPTAAPGDPSGPAFAVTRLAGTPRVGETAIDTTGQLGVGQWLETDATSRARVEVATIGRVEVAEGTRLRLAATGPDQHRLDLLRGSISARVVAPPRLFIVGTPAATAVDLGCAYTLAVDARGAGSLRVTWGWVALEAGGRASFVPAGATCSTRLGQAPGTPAFDDAPAALREALVRFDFEAGGEAAARVVLGRARPRDALTVWHLLGRVEEPLRRDVYRRLAALSAPPRGVDEVTALKLEPAALEKWRDSLMRGLVPITW